MFCNFHIGEVRTNIELLLTLRLVTAKIISFLISDTQHCNFLCPPQLKAKYEVCQMNVPRLEGH